MTVEKKTKRKVSKASRREARNFYLYITPWLIGFSLFTIIPMVSSLIYSLQNISVLDLGVGGTFVGLQNYKDVFKDDIFIASIGNMTVFGHQTIVLSSLARGKPARVRDISWLPGTKKKGAWDLPTMLINSCHCSRKCLGDCLLI